MFQEGQGKDTAKDIMENNDDSFETKNANVNPRINQNLFIAILIICHDPNNHLGSLLAVGPQNFALGSSPTYTIRLISAKMYFT